MLGGGADSKFPELHLCLEKVTSLDSTVDKAALKAAASLFLLFFLVFFFFFFQDTQVSCEMPSPACRTMAKNDGGLKLLPSSPTCCSCTLQNKKIGKQLLRRLCSDPLCHIETILVPTIAAPATELCHHIKFTEIRHFHVVFASQSHAEWMWYKHTCADTYFKSVTRTSW